MPDYQKSYEIIGYTYDADVHCIACTVEYVRTLHKLSPNDLTHTTIMGFAGWDNGVWTTVEFTDSEGNDVHPVFADQYGDFVSEVDNDHGGVTQYAPVCSDCGEELPGW